jgi:DNA phosphorothioation-associated putative methyltransferase
MSSPGKQVGQRLYIGIDQVEHLDEPSRDLVARAQSLLDSQVNETFNVLRVDVSTQDVSFLSYPDLGRCPFPTLASSCRVNVPARLLRRRRYDRSLNPPILHRTELLLPPSHPARKQCEALTATCEALGLFDQPTIIGFKQQWDALIAERGFSIVDFELIPLANAIDAAGPPSDTNANVERHLTALARTSLSAPVQSLLRDQLLTLTSSFFDYGCGRGDDLATLTAAGYRAQGWDPHYRPDGERVAADVVNLGFVINVIEDKQERMEALEGAYRLATRVLAVSAMLGSNDSSKGRAFADGVLTARNTFQKYYSQGELRTFIESVLDEEAYPAAPGVFYVFRDRALEQQYLLLKSSNGSRVHRLIAQVPVHVRNDRARDPAARSIAKPARKRNDRSGRQESAEAQQHLTALWRLMLELGRTPDPEEIPFAAALKEHFGSVKRSIDRCLAANDPQALHRSERERREDILVMYALRAFDRRRRFGKLEPRLGRDIRAFFGSVVNAEAQATDLLFSVQDTAAIQRACEDASTEGLGWLERGESLQLHTSLVSRLPANLRVYVGCATIMAGDISAFDLVKVHINSGKVSLMAYDDFVGKPLPLLLRRLKVRLRDQELDVFEYDDRHPPPVLFRKSRYINEEFPRFADQVAFEEELERLHAFDLDGYGPPWATFESQLASRRWRVDGFHLARAEDIPHLDAACGRHFRFRDLIECGDTWKAHRPPNVPLQPETYNSLCDLAVEVLDPVIDYFGGIELTYGFASPALTRHISSRIAPELDQHASCEIKRTGALVCERRGAAVDFIVRDEDMVEVARWIAHNCQFDRIYFYGADRPLHVSVGPESARAVYEMVRSGSRTVPRRWNVEPT